MGFILSYFLATPSLKHQVEGEDAMKNLFTDYETVDKMFIQDFICVSGVIKVLM